MQPAGGTGLPASQLTNLALRTTLPAVLAGRRQRERRWQGGRIMSNKTCAVLAATLLCTSLPAVAQGLPDGPGKEIAAATCNSCHTLLSRVGSGYTPQGWSTVLRMMQNQGAPLPADQVEPLRQYLIKAFPEKPKPAGAVIEGPETISFQEWPAPTPGSRPHDPLAARDGALWYTGQLANVLGRVDPSTGKVTEFPLQTAHSGPHGLVEDRDGNIWYTGNTGSLIGRLDPKTGAVSEYRTPEPGDPHTLIFDSDGILWFTMQNANRIGRLDPKSGEIKLTALPTDGARPYGMAFNSKGILFFDEFGTNQVGSIDPRTLAVREYMLPNPAARPRRIAITSDDMVWYTDYARGFLGRLDPATGNVTEWASPSGPKSEPYGISAIKDIIWYSESGSTPNTVVRFDPKSQKFQSWHIPGGGNIVRNTSVTPDGNFLLANSLVNGITLVTIGK
jgi:virginiamycin B lyase